MVKRIAKRSKRTSRVSVFDLAYRAGVATPKGMKYMRAGHDLEIFGYNVKVDGKTVVFIKNENKRINDYSTEDEKDDPDPRVITFRSPKHAALIASFLSPMEHDILQWKGERLFKKNGPRGRLFGKGLNTYERADLIDNKRRRFKNPLVISIDASRFDRQVDATMLGFEHVIYLAMASNMDSQDRKLLARLLDIQIHNSGSSESGGANLKYKVEGRRCSGDINTGVGNCLQFLIIVGSYFLGEACPWDAAIDGDDTLLFMEESDYHKHSEKLKSHFYDVGHNIRVESVAKQLHEVEWCQHKVANIEGRLRMVRNPLVIVSKSLCSLKYGKDPTSAARHLFTVALSELIVGQGLPIVQDWAMNVIHNCEKAGYKPYDLVHTNENSLFIRVALELRSMGYASEAKKVMSYYRPTPSYEELVQTTWRICKKLLQKFTKKEPSMQTHVEYAKLFGISIERQLSLASMFNTAEYEFQAIRESYLDKRGCFDEIDAITRQPHTVPSPAIPGEENT